MVTDVVFKKDINYYKKLIKDLWIAFRPLSLTLAIGSTTLGIVSAYNKGFILNGSNVLKIILITIAGILAQGGANLINDYFENLISFLKLFYRL